MPRSQYYVLQNSFCCVSVSPSAATPQPTAQPDCDCEGGLSGWIQITIAAVVGFSVVIVLLGVFVFAVVKLAKFVKGTRKMK